MHSRGTLNAENTGLILPKIKTQMGKRSFSYEGAVIWNSLPYYVRNALTSSLFSILFWRHARSNSSVGSL